jgi:hypothetical protein
MNAAVSPLEMLIPAEAHPQRPAVYMVMDHAETDLQKIGTNMRATKRRFSSSQVGISPQA